MVVALLMKHERLTEESGSARCESSKDRGDENESKHVAVRAKMKEVAVLGSRQPRNPPFVSDTNAASTTLKR